jgi:sugar/nucleoside kinase (ribokinase family)
MEAGVTRAVVSLSGEGVLCGENGQMFQKPASGKTIVDTTGAGDSLSASLAVGLAYGLELERCAELGMAAAGITMSQPGAVTKELAKLALR